MTLLPKMTLPYFPVCKSHLFSEFFVGASYRKVQLICILFPWKKLPSKLDMRSAQGSCYGLCAHYGGTGFFLCSSCQASCEKDSSNASGSRLTMSSPTQKSAHLQIAFKIQHAPLCKLHSCYESTSPPPPSPSHDAFPLSSLVCDSAHRRMRSFARTAYGDNVIGLRLCPERHGDHNSRNAAGVPTLLSQFCRHGTNTLACDPRSRSETSLCFLNRLLNKQAHPP